MRLAVVGLGRIGTLHARTLAAIDGVEPLIVRGRDARHATALAEELGAASFASLDDACEVADGVVIATATDAHAPLVRAAIERRIPTFCEKPLTADLASSVALAADIEASGVPFQLGFQRRFDAGYVEARRLIASGELGTLYLAYMAAHDPEPPPEDFIASSGGLFADLGVHDFDMIRYLTGSEIVDVHAEGAINTHAPFAAHEDVDTAVAMLRTDSGLLAIMGLARHDPLGHDIRMELFGSGDSVSIGLGPRTPLRSLEPGVPPPPGPPWRIFLERWDEAYRAQLEAFTRLVAGATTSAANALDGVAAMRVAEAARRSMRDHRAVRVEEIT